MPPPPPPRIPPRAIAPGSVPRAAPNPNPPALHPKPKPIGPAKGGPPPFGTKPPKPGTAAALANKGLGTFQGSKLPGHADFHSHKTTNAQLAGRTQGVNPRGQPAPPVPVASRPLSKADQTRTNRIVGKSPLVQQANKEMAAAKPGAFRNVPVPIPPGRTAPMQRVATGRPGATPVMSDQRAKSIFVKVEKTNAGVIHKTVVGQVGKKP